MCIENGPVVQPGELADAISYVMPYTASIACAKKRKMMKKGIEGAKNLTPLF